MPTKAKIVLNISISNVEGRADQREKFTDLADEQEHNDDDTCECDEGGLFVTPRFL